MQDNLRPAQSSSRELLVCLADTAVYGSRATRDFYKEIQVSEVGCRLFEILYESSPVVFGQPGPLSDAFPIGRVDPL